MEREPKISSMPGHVFTIEELMLDDSFVNYCLSTGPAVPSRWKKIIRDQPSQEKTFEEAKRLVLALHGGLSRPEVNRQIEIVRRQLYGRKNENAEPVVDAGPSLSAEFVITNKGKIKRRFLKKMAYTALAICIMITGVLWWSVYRPVANTSSLSSQPTQVQNYHSPLGQRKKINLADGSLIILNSNSSVSVAFTNNKREVRLNGDAFFQVAKDELKPFIVYAKNVAATVMGTKFYVHGRKDDETSLQVDLLEGKVQMVEMGSPTSRQPIILNPGESGRFGEQSSLEIRPFDSLHLRSWITGHIHFNETPLMKAVNQLENWYGIKIEVWNEELKKKAVNGDYIDEPLQNILDMICFSTNRRYSIKDNKVIIE